MALNLGSLYVSVTAETSGLSKGLEQSLKQVERFSKELKRAANDVRDISAVITGMGVAAFAKAGEASYSASRAVEQLSNAWAQVAVPLSTALMPVMQKVISILNELGKYISGLTPEMREMIVTVAEWAIGLTIGAAVIAKLAGLVAGLAGMASMLAMFAVPLLEIIVVVAALGAAALFLHKVWRENWGGIQQFTASIVKDMGEAFKWLGDTLGGVYKFMIDQAKLWVDSMIDLLAWIEKASKINLGSSGLREGFNGLFADLKSGDFLKHGVTFGKQIADGIVAGASSLKDEFMGIVDPIVAEAKKRFSKMFPKGSLQVDDGTVGRVLAALQAQFEAMMRGAGRGAIQASSGVAGNQVSASHYQIPAGMIGAGTDALGKIEADAAKLLANQNKAGTGYEFAPSLKPTGMLNRISQVSPAAQAIPAELGWLDKATSALGLKMTPFLARLQEALPQIAESIGNFASGLGDTLLSKLGDLGSMVQTVINGIKTGNVWGALGSVLGDLFSKSSSFGKLMDRMSSVLGDLVKAVGPLLDALMVGLGPFISAVGSVISVIVSALQPIFEVLGTVLQAITPFIVLVSKIVAILAPIIKLFASILMVLFKVLEPILRPLFEVARVVLMFIVGIIKAIADIWNAIVDALAAVINGIVTVLTFGAEQHAGDKLLGGLRLSTDGLTQAQADLAAMTYDNANAASDATKKLNDFAAALTNAPDMFKIGFARMQADTGQTGYDPRASNTASSGNPAGPIGTTDGTGSTGVSVGGGGNGQGNNTTVHRAQ